MPTRFAYKGQCAYASKLAMADANANLQMTCVKQCLAQENALFVSPAFIGSSGARDQVGILIQNCFVNAPAEGQSAMDFVKSEFKKITWPDKSSLLKQTVAVIGTSFVVGLIIVIVDWIIRYGVNILLSF